MISRMFEIRVSFQSTKIQSNSPQLANVSPERYDLCHLWERLQLCRSAKFGLYSNYISVNESVKWIERWLNYQFGGDEGEIFLNQLFQLINSTTKKNCMWLVGPANSGKTMIFKSLAESLVRYATIKCSSSNIFAFAGAEGVKCLFLDEFAYDEKNEPKRIVRWPTVSGTKETPGWPDDCASPSTNVYKWFALRHGQQCMEGSDYSVHC